MVFSTQVKSFWSIGEDEPGGPSPDDLLTITIKFWSGKTQELMLYEFLGVEKGRFKLGGNNLRREASLYSLKGTILKAHLRYGRPVVDDNGAYLKVERRIDLNECLHYIPGKAGQEERVEFQLPSKKVRETCSCAQLHGTLLSALCLGDDGALHQSTIDLGRYVRCDYATGILHSDTEGGLDDQTAVLTLEDWGVSGKLRHKTKLISKFNLAEHLENDHGQLRWRGTGLTDRDGPIANFMENVPFIGFIAGVFQAAAGNKDQANRTLAKVTNCTIICVAGLLTGFVGAGLELSLTAGAVAASVTAATFTPMAKFVENAITDNTVNAEKKQTLEEKLRGYIKDAIINACAAGAAPILCARLLELTGTAAKLAAKSKLKKWMIQNATEYNISILLPPAEQKLWDVIVEDAWNILGDGVNEASKEL